MCSLSTRLRISVLQLVQLRSDVRIACALRPATRAECEACNAYQDGINSSRQTIPELRTRIFDCSVMRGPLQVQLQATTIAPGRQDCKAEESRCGLPVFWKIRYADLGVESATQCASRSNTPRVPLVWNSGSWLSFFSEPLTGAPDVYVNRPTMVFEPAVTFPQ